MQFTVDDPALPMGPVLSAALGYLFGLGFVGYVALWKWLKARAEWPPWLTNLTIGLHSVLGITAVTVAPASLLHRLKLHAGTGLSGGIAFAVTIIAMIGVGMLVARNSSPSARFERPSR